MACKILQKQIEIIAGKVENIIVPSEHLKNLSANPEPGMLLNNSKDHINRLKSQFVV